MRPEGLGKFKVLHHRVSNLAPHKLHSGSVDLHNIHRCLAILNTINISISEFSFLRSIEDHTLFTTQKINVPTCGYKLAFDNTSFILPSNNMPS
jgi:hypothetical protein